MGASSLALKEALVDQELVPGRSCYRGRFLTLLFMIIGMTVVLSVAACTHIFRDLAVQDAATLVSLKPRWTSSMQQSYWWVRPQQTWAFRHHLQPAQSLQHVQPTGAWKPQSTAEAFVRASSVAVTAALSRAGGMPRPAFRGSVDSFQQASPDCPAESLGATGQVTKLNGEDVMAVMNCDTDHIIVFAYYAKWCQTCKATGQVTKLNGEDVMAVMNCDTDHIIVFAYYAKWCQTCKATKFKLTQMAKELPEVRFFEVDFGENKDICQSLGIDKIPFVEMYQFGKGKLDNFVCTPKQVPRLKMRLDYELRTAKYGYQYAR
eukprot:gnl/TRDRNA2_/TRDRNA2_144074_c0_seq1.p1 gnl/TRDRNA2_/TRDRNA2_144074_c0~~gnl/TRDRNA2_/TRDRNA2_144074_c0_seq1.p1  ORF type:complete len:319 (-),score=61.43 gnl/TRDRNA2_/TRDRNA2_144074_c0_seq1:30-986(-)